MPGNGVKMNAAEGSIVVNAPISGVYRRWLRVEEFPKFMTAVKRGAKSGREPFLYRGWLSRQAA